MKLKSIVGNYFKGKPLVYYEIIVISIFKVFGVFVDKNAETQ